MKKNTKRIILGIVAITLIVGLVGYSYSVEKAKQSGKQFGIELKSIQDELKDEQVGFDVKLVAISEGQITQDEFESYAKMHFAAMQRIIDRYDSLEPPATYESAVNLFKLSTQSQLDRDRQEVLFVQTSDLSHETRAAYLHQESFEYELAALADYKAAQAGQKP